ncbi:hypothetical protein ACEQ8H_003586 [Pleosporales sp. CAS-2024a]
MTASFRTSTIDLGLSEAQPMDRQAHEFLGELTGKAMVRNLIIRVWDERGIESTQMCLTSHEQMEETSHMDEFQDLRTLDSKHSTDDKLYGSRSWDIFDSDKNNGLENSDLISTQKETLMTAKAAFGPVSLLQPPTWTALPGAQMAKTINAMSRLSVQEPASDLEPSPAKSCSSVYPVNPRPERYELDYRNRNHGLVAAVLCVHDHCHTHYREKVKMGFFPRQREETRTCLYAAWYHCLSDLCATHLWDKRERMRFPGHEDPAEILQMKAMSYGVCVQEQWATCLNDSCWFHHHDKIRNGFGSGSS